MLCWRGCEGGYTGKNLSCRCLQECPFACEKGDMATCLRQSPGPFTLLLRRHGGCSGRFSRQGRRTPRLSVWWLRTIISHLCAGASCSMGSRAQARHWQRGRWQGRAPGARPSRWRSSRARAPTASASSAGRPSAPCACCSKRRARSLQQRVGLRRLRITFPVMACGHALTLSSLPVGAFKASQERCLLPSACRPVLLPARPPGRAVSLQAAARAPSIVFLDELDGLVPARSAGSDPGCADLRQRGVHPPRAHGRRVGPRQRHRCGRHKQVRRCRVASELLPKTTPCLVLGQIL